MLRIRGRTKSLNVQKVIGAGSELVPPIARIDVGIAFDPKNTPVQRAMNPNRLVPAMDHDGFMLWPSHAIVRYRAHVQ